MNESMLHTVVLKNISKDKIQVKAEGKIPVIGMIPGQIVTKFLQEEVPSRMGYLLQIVNILNYVYLNVTAEQAMQLRHRSRDMG